MHLTCKKHFSKICQDRFGRLDMRNCVKEIFLRPCSKVHQVLMQLKLQWWPYIIPDCDNSAETKLKTNRRAGSRLGRLPWTKMKKDWAGTWIERPQSISLCNRCVFVGWRHLKHTPSPCIKVKSWTITEPLKNRGEVLHLYRWSTHTHTHTYTSLTHSQTWLPVAGSESGNIGKGCQGNRRSRIQKGAQTKGWD